MDWASVVYKIN